MYHMRVRIKRGLNARNAKGGILTNMEKEECIAKHADTHFDQLGSAMKKILSG